MTAAKDTKKYTLTIDAERSTHRLVEDATGHLSFPFLSREEFMAVASSHQPMAIFLAVDLDRSNGGLELLPVLTRLYPDAPVLMIGSSGDLKSLTQAFALGAADFLVRPLAKAEIMARMFRRVADLKRQSAAIEKPTWGDIALTLEERLVTCAAKSATLAMVPFNLLRSLVTARGNVIDREALAAAGWHGTAVSRNSLDQQIHFVRKSLGDVGSRLAIKSVYGVGFHLVDPASGQGADDSRVSA